MSDIPAHRHEVKLRSGDTQIIHGGNDDAPPKVRKPRGRNPKAKKPPSDPTAAPSPAAETTGEA